MAVLLPFSDTTARIGHMTTNIGQDEIRVPALFGNPTRTRILFVLSLLGESYPRELARIIEAPLSAVQKAIDRLETEGVVASRRIGVERRVTLNPRYPFVKDLQSLLFRWAQADTPIVEATRSLRRRPRRRTKSL